MVCNEFSVSSPCDVMANSKKKTLSGDLRLLVPNLIASNEKFKPEATGHVTRLYLSI